jgi:hypothetical protein
VNALFAAASTLVFPDPPTPEITVIGAVPSTIALTADAALRTAAIPDRPRGLTTESVRHVWPGGMFALEAM